MSNMELYLLKIGNSRGKDLSLDEVVQTGVKEEPIIRELYAAEHPEMEVEYHATDVLWQEERPWLRATLDGELLEKEAGRKGILEIKCSQVISKTMWENWNGRIPQHYYCQILAQLACTGYEFADVCARLKKRDGDLEIRTYRFERINCFEDMKWMTDQVDAFWEKVQKREQPSLKLPEI